MMSNHYKNDRVKRENLIAEIGYGKVVKSVVIDNHHPNGAEIHEVSDTGIITIYNQRTHKLVTKLIARPGQIRRYFEDGKAPKYLINLAIEHQKMAYNYF